MPKPYFTMSLDVVGKPCLVVGGDDEALEKSERLVEAQARLTVIGRKVLPQLEAFCAAKGVTLHKRDFQDADLDGMFFVLNCVKSDPPLSERIYRLGLARHAIVSAYDQPQYSNAVMQALVRAGQMRIGIGSGGASPGVAAALRKALERILDEDFARFTESAAAMRECMIAAGMSPKERKDRFRKALEGFAIEGKVRYPDFYRKNVEKGVEKAACGLWMRKK